MNSWVVTMFNKSHTDLDLWPLFVRCKCTHLKKLPYRTRTSRTSIANTDVTIVKPKRPLISVSSANEILQAGERNNAHEDWPRLYQTSISPLSVRTSMILWPRKSSDSLFRRCFTFDLMSSSSSHTRTLIRSEKLWHSLEVLFKKNRKKKRRGKHRKTCNKKMI